MTSIYYIYYTAPRLRTFVVFRATARLSSPRRSSGNPRATPLSPPRRDAASAASRSDVGNLGFLAVLHGFFAN